LPCRAFADGPHGLRPNRCGNADIQNFLAQGNRIKKEEVRAKSAKHAKDSERGFTQPVDQPINVSFEQISSEMDEQPEFELGKPQIGQYLLTMDTGGRLNRF
jgi:hypothetical protein